MADSRGRRLRVALAKQKWVPPEVVYDARQTAGPHSRRSKVLREISTLLMSRASDSLDMLLEIILTSCTLSTTVCSANEYYVLWVAVFLFVHGAVGVFHQVGERSQAVRVKPGTADT